MKSLTFLTCVLAVGAMSLPATGCRKAVEHEHDELPTLSVTNWTEKTELFMEHPLLVANSDVRMAVHLTTLADFKPLNTGRPVIELVDRGGKTTTLPGTDPLRPGAFRVEGRVPAAGTYTWRLRVQAGTLTDVHDLGSITVYADEHAALAAPAAPEGPPAIAYLKEQQWVSDFATNVARPEPMRTAVRATATVVATAGGEVVVAAPSAGRLVAARLPRIGDRVTRGTLLAFFEPHLASLEDRSQLQQQVVEARAAVEAAVAEHARAERLLAEKAVPARRVEEAARALTVARGQMVSAEARLAQRDRALKPAGPGVTDQAFELRAPISGMVVALAGTPGAAYEAGAELLRLVQTNPVVIEAQLPPSSADLRDRVTGLALEIPGLPEPVATRITRQAHAAVVDPRTRAVVLRFEVDNVSGQLLIGQAGTAVLFTRETASVPTVPPRAVLTEAGRPYVFVQVGGEAFERRTVRLGARDGDRVAVLAGVAPGDRVVTRGTYDIQLASAARGLPAEGHVH